MAVRLVVVVRLFFLKRTQFKPPILKGVLWPPCSAAAAGQHIQICFARELSFNAIKYASLKINSLSLAFLHQCLIAFALLLALFYRLNSYMKNTPRITTLTIQEVLR